jgi:hypothetical protein
VQLDVATASPYYDVTGGGPVLLPLPGGAADGAALTRLARLVADACTIVTHRPTGISRPRRRHYRSDPSRRRGPRAGCGEPRSRVRLRPNRM